MTPALAADESGASAYKELEWIDLLPQEDLDALMNPPEYLDEIADGSEQDTLASNLSAAENELASWPLGVEALVSTRVVESLDGEAIRLPGFIVPLEFGEDEKVTKFFLVPYFRRLPAHAAATAEPDCLCGIQRMGWNCRVSMTRSGSRASSLQR